jgi:hypothetical protein
VAVVAARGDVQVLVVVQHPHVGLLGGRSAFARQLLDEVAGAGHARVDVLVEEPVDLEGPCMRTARIVARPFSSRLMTAGAIGAGGSVSAAAPLEGRAATGG